MCVNIYSIYSPFSIGGFWDEYLGPNPVQQIRRIYLPVKPGFKFRRIFSVTSKLKIHEKLYNKIQVSYENNAHLSKLFFHFSHLSFFQTLKSHLFFSSLKIKKISISSEIYIFIFLFFQ